MVCLFFTRLGVGHHLSLNLDGGKLSASVASACDGSATAAAIIVNYVDVAAQRRARPRSTPAAAATAAASSSRSDSFPVGSACHLAPNVDDRDALVFAL